MAEYIEREAAIELLKQRLYETALNSTGFNADAGDVFADAAERLEKTWINEIPAADVREVKRGKWEEVEVSYIEDMYDKGNLPETIVSMYCPICERYHNEIYWYGNPTENINFCPNCGADMRPPKEE